MRYLLGFPFAFLWVALCLPGTATSSSIATAFNGPIEFVNGSSIQPNPIAQQPKPPPPRAKAKSSSKQKKPAARSSVSGQKKKATQVRPKVSSPTKKASKRPANPATKKPLTAKQIEAVRKTLRSAGTAIKLDKHLRGHKVVARGADALKKADVPHKNRAEVRKAFDGEIIAIELTRPMIVHRRHGGEADPISFYTSRTNYKKPGNAQRFSALPLKNTAKEQNLLLIPKGSIILVGKAANQTKDTKNFGKNAVGGGEQIYFSDRSKFIPLKFN